MYVWLHVFSINNIMVTTVCMIARVCRKDKIRQAFKKSKSASTSKWRCWQYGVFCIQFV